MIIFRDFTYIQSAILRCTQHTKHNFYIAPIAILILIIAYLRTECKDFCCCKPTATGAQENAEEKIHDQLHDVMMSGHSCRLAVYALGPFVQLHSSCTRATKKFCQPESPLCQPTKSVPAQIDRSHKLEWHFFTPGVHTRCQHKSTRVCAAQL